jgi:3-dehydroquinate synthetase
VSVEDHNSQEDANNNLELDVDSDADISLSTKPIDNSIDTDSDEDEDASSKEDVSTKQDAETSAQDTDADSDADSDADTDVDQDVPEGYVAPIRRWVSLAKGSCDVRVGSGVLDGMGEVLRGPLGTSRSCALLVEDGTDAALVELIRRQLSDAGFLAHQLDAPRGSNARTPQVATELFDELAQLHITVDDLICAVGGADLLSFAAYICGSWCGGTSLACVPVDGPAVLAGVISPRGLDVGGSAELVSVRGCAKQLFADIDIIFQDPSSEPARYVRAFAARVALADSEKSFAALWDRAGELAAGSRAILADQLVDTLRSCGRLATSTSIALRQALDYGKTFIRAVSRLVPPDTAESTIIAEALRFSSRLSCGKGELSVDDVLAVDELLERLELGQLSCDIDPSEMIRALKEDRFLRSSRFLLGLPRSLGRVRLATVEDELLSEHVRAWCKSRSPQLEKTSQS